MGDVAVDLNNYKQRARHGDILDELRAHMGELAGDKTVASLSGFEFQKSATDNRTLTQKVIDFFNSIGNRVIRADIGEISLNSAGAHDSLGHGFGKVKAATFAALPNVLKNGRIIRTNGAYDGHNYDGIYIGAPVSVGGDICYVGALVIKDEKMQRYKLHEVLTTNGDGAPLFQSESVSTEKGTDGPLRSDAPSESPNGSLSSDTTLTQPANVVKSARTVEIDRANTARGERFYPVYVDGNMRTPVMPGRTYQTENFMRSVLPQAIVRYSPSFSSIGACASLASSLSIASASASFAARAILSKTPSPA